MALSLLIKSTISVRPASVRLCCLPRRLTGQVFRPPSRSQCLTRFSSSQSPNPVDSLPKGTQEKKGGPITWKSLIISAALVGLLLQFLNTVKQKKRKELEREQTKSLGKAAIGGEFELIDQASKPACSKDFLGKWILLYFGFTHCPDICPEELEKMAKVVDMIDKVEGKDALQPLFISVDPERDSPELIGKYVADFSPRFIGLTGSIDQIKDVCHKFRIYFSMGPKEDNDYIVDHSIIMYLLDPKGDFVDYYSQNKSADDIFNSVHMHILKNKVIHK